MYGNNVSASKLYRPLLSSLLTLLTLIAVALQNGKRVEGSCHSSSFDSMKL